MSKIVEKILLFLKLLSGSADGGTSPSVSFLLEENKKLKAKVISLELENKILRGYHEIEKKISDMSDDEFDGYADRSIRGRKPQ